jgi:hypothetical protein
MNTAPCPGACPSWTLSWAARPPHGGDVGGQRGEVSHGERRVDEQAAAVGCDHQGAGARQPRGGGYQHAVGYRPQTLHPTFLPVSWQAGLLVIGHQMRPTWTVVDEPEPARSRT